MNIFVHVLDQGLIFLNSNIVFNLLVQTKINVCKFIKKAIFMFPSTLNK